MTSIQDLRNELTSFRYSDYARRLPALQDAVEATSRLRLAILSSHTAEPIEMPLKFLARLDGIDLDVYFGGFNQTAQEILDPASGLHSAGPGFVIVMDRLRDHLPELFSDYLDGGHDHWKSRLDAFLEQVVSLVSKIAGELDTQVIVQNSALPTHSESTMFDAQQAQSQSALIASFNSDLAGRLRGVDGAFVWDFASLANSLGAAQLADHRMWYLSSNPYQLSAYANIAQDLYRYIAAIRGDIRKCVVLDLDNTLWGGVIGEDGMSGIKLGQTYPGNCFRAFQLRLLGLRREGFVLAINSKNNETDAMQVLEDHPEMILRKEHFACWRINWQDKATNLREIATELNIGLDSIVMIDDNETECEWIRTQLPMVAVCQLPSEPFNIPESLDTIAGLHRVSLLDEDVQKAEMYRVQRKRAEEQASFGSLDEFLSSLDLKVAIETANDYSIPRVAQLTQKTNQFNLTTRRYAESDISAICSSDDAQVIAVSVEDRFGAYGIVGAAILRFRQSSCDIDTFLLSCRVIGRGIEDAMMAGIADSARNRGTDVLSGQFIPTQKNAPAADLYRRLGFEEVAENSFELKLSKSILRVPDFLEVQA